MNIIPTNSKILNKTAYLFLIIIFLSSPVSSYAQMFSIGDSSPERQQNLGTSTIISAGWETGQFDFRGDPLLPDENLSFDNSILRFRLETPGIDIGVGLGGAFTSMDSNNYLNVSGRLHNNLNIYRSEDREFIFQLPIQITTDLKRVQGNSTDNEFQQSSFIFGSGVYSAVRLSDRFDFTVKATPNYGFSFSQGNLFGGSLFRFDGRTQLLIREILGRHGLAVSYHFDFRRYEIDGDQNDYDFTSHSISIGFLF